MSHPSDAPDDVHFHIPRAVWWGGIIVPSVGSLIWLAFHLYAQLLDIETKLGTERAAKKHVEDVKSTCVLVVDEEGVGRCRFNETRLRLPPP